MPRPDRGMAQRYTAKKRKKRPSAGRAPVARVDALNAGQLGGAGLDVFDDEPIPTDHPLLACQQVVLTPHNADQTPEGMDLLNAGVVDNVIAFLQGHSRNRVV